MKSTCEYSYNKEKDGFVFVTNDDISMGDELFLNYGEHNFGLYLFINYGFFIESNSGNLAIIAL